MIQKRYDLFTVFKNEELERLFTNQPQLKESFETIKLLIELQRVDFNKTPRNTYIACNQDEPYANKVWEVILQGEKDKKEELKKFKEA